MANLLYTPKQQTENFEIGNTIKWIEILFDGRVYDRKIHYGKVVKVNRVNLKAEDSLGRLWQVEKSEAIIC